MEKGIYYNVGRLRNNRPLSKQSGSLHTPTHPSKLHIPTQSPLLGQARHKHKDGESPTKKMVVEHPSHVSGELAHSTKSRKPGNTSKSEYSSRGMTVLAGTTLDAMPLTWWYKGGVKGSGEGRLG